MSDWIRQCERVVAIGIFLCAGWMHGYAEDVASFPHVTNQNHILTSTANQSAGRAQEPWSPRGGSVTERADILTSTAMGPFEVQTRQEGEKDEFTLN